MARLVPSQIVAFLSAHFTKDIPFDHGVALQKIGALKALIKMASEIPGDLLPTAPDRHAEFTASVAAIEFAIDRTQNSGTADPLRPVSGHVGVLWRNLELLPDQAISTGTDLAFIKDAVMRSMIGLDLRAVETALQSGEWKGATIISGSCCEALLLYGVQTKDAQAPGLMATAHKTITWNGKSPDVANLLDASWSLFSYATVAAKMGIISSNTQKELEPARDYRNLIHPAKAVRQGVSFDRGTAFVGTGALDHVISDLRKNL